MSTIPVLPSGNVCFRLTLVASSSILLHYNDERPAQDCRGRTSDSKRRWRKKPPLAGHVGPIQNSYIQLGFLAAFTAVSLPCSFRVVRRTISPHKFVLEIRAVIFCHGTGREYRCMRRLGNAPNRPCTYFVWSTRAVSYKFAGTQAGQSTQNTQSNTPAG
jgi:hypothetical protein